MAEGHTVLRWAGRLSALVNEPLVAVDLPAKLAGHASALVGECLTGIATHGKHLLLHLSDGRTLHCHALMYGSWQVGRAGMSLRKPVKRVRLRLRTADHEAVFFNGPVVELLTQGELESHPRLTALGPDLLAPDFDREEAWRRLQSEPTREIGDAILDQTLVAGVGNIYKCEGLFLARIPPRVPVGSVPRPAVRRLWNILIPLMRKGAAASRIRTRPRPRAGEDARFWVYRRRGKPCFRCEEAIARIVQGKLKRSTYYCPDCQAPDGEDLADRSADVVVQPNLPGLE